ncbi:MAG: HlyD family efflux transporter periplasmic adaptor subunit [Calothrix sp. MO_167.B12]|nr:HlyD family efflux transporter periplasmic adaptor subunit [Calothrix sp. MO_167.B12]
MPIQKNHEELLPKVSNWAKLGGLILLGAGGITVLLAATIKYPIAVKTTAIIRPIGEIKIVEAGASGVISHIFVQENQRVTQGTKLAQIENSQLDGKKNQINLNIQQHKLQLTQLNSQLKELNAQIAAETTGIKGAIASARAQLSRTQREYQDKQIVTQAEIQSASAALELAKEEVKRYQQLSKTGAVSSLQFKEKEKAFKAAQAKLQRAQVGINPNTANLAIAQQNIIQKQAQGESTLASLRKERQSLQQRLIAMTNQLSRYHQELKQVEQDLQKTIIRAPQGGTILKLKLRNPGQVVNPGNAIAQIAPQDADLVVKAKIPVADIRKVNICQAELVKNCQVGKVKMRISAYPYTDYGILKGAVRAITPDAIVPSTEENNPVTGSYYEVTIEPEKPYLQKKSKRYPLKAGMEAKAEIFAKKETLLILLLRKTRLGTNL